MDIRQSYEYKILVGGGYAFAIHARPRFTGDLDIFLEAQQSNAQKVLDALKEFGFGDDGIGLDDLTKPGQVIQLGRSPLRIGLLTSITDVLFADAWHRKAMAKYGEQTVYFIGKEDLIVNKRGSGRKKVLEDLDELVLV